MEGGQSEYECWINSVSVSELAPITSIHLSLHHTHALFPFGSQSGNTARLQGRALSISIIRPQEQGIPVLAPRLILNRYPPPPGSTVEALTWPQTNVSGAQLY